MKTVEITEASLADYGRSARAETWVLTRRGKPVAAVVPIRRGMDLESYGLSHNPEFIEIINRSWSGYKKSGGVSLEDVRKKYPPLKRTRKASTRRPR
jgi:antitoxin (DNA-binding transcriptional repressor) of toxin-antitoxin stability system